MLQKILRAPSLYFDTTPSGRILNRFSNDLGQMDLVLIYVMCDSLEIPLLFLTILITLVILNPYFGIAALILIFIGAKFFIFAKPLMVLGRQLDLNYKSPVFSFISTTLSGITPLRVYGQRETFISQMLKHCDNSMSAIMLFLNFSRVFGFYIEMLCAIINTIGIFIIIPVALSQDDS